MKKAVLISIRPEWCALIASRKKTIEVRRTRPDLPTPFKCYIYCTQRQKPALVNLQNLPETPYLTTTGNFSKKYELPDMDWARLCNGKVIGEFTCDEISNYVLYGGALSKKRYVRMDYLFRPSGINYPAICMTEEAFVEYAAGRKMHGWHISGLTIYERPRELTDFWRPCAPGDPDAKALCIECRRDAENFCGQERIMRAPQSWRYVEEI